MSSDVLSVIGSILGIILLNKPAEKVASTPFTEYAEKRIEQIDRRLASMESRESPVEEKSLADERSEQFTPRTSTTMSHSEISTACLSCAMAHMTTISGTLNEAMRFARDLTGEGILHPEVKSRLLTAQEDVTIIERHDWTPRKIAVAAPREQEFIRQFLPKLRNLRQDIVDIDSIEKLEEATANAQIMADGLLTAIWQIKGVGEKPEDKAPVPVLSDSAKRQLVEMAFDVQSGKLTLEEAKAKVRNGHLILGPPPEDNVSGGVTDEHKAL